MSLPAYENRFALIQSQMADMEQRIKELESIVEELQDKTNFIRRC